MRNALFTSLALSLLTFSVAHADKKKKSADPESTALENIPVVRYRLKNGLRMVLSQDRTVPTVAVSVYYDVGSRNEPVGRTGFAHLFEHMMFQGSENVAKGEHFQLVMNRGGSLNGTTNADRTNYYETLPSNELDLGLWLEADRMRSLAVNALNFENQRQTVMEERRQSYDNRAYAKSMLRINELAYGDYWPYAHSTIGKMEDLQKAPLEAVREFFETYYRPNNAVVSVAGDFEVETAARKIQKYFGTIDKGTVPEFKEPKWVPQKAEKKESISDPKADLPAFHMAFHVPPRRQKDHYPLKLLSMALGDGKSSRLYRKLVRGRAQCQSLDVALDGRRGPDLFSFWAIIARSGDAETARKVIFEELDSIEKKGLQKQELEKVKTRLKAAFIFGMQSNLSRAQRLAEFELYYGDARLLKSELGRYLRVTNEDIQRVTKQYFTEANRTILDVVPESGQK